jgi:hypothetical protein
MLTRMQTSVRVSIRNRDALARVATEDYGGVTLDEALARLLDEHWERQAVAAVEASQRTDPESFAAYVREADAEDRRFGTPVEEPWDGPAPGGLGTMDIVWTHRAVGAFTDSVDRLVEATRVLQELGRSLPERPA